MVEHSGPRILMAGIGRRDFADDLGDEPSIDALNFTAHNNNASEASKDEFGLPLKPAFGGRGGISLAPISTGAGSGGGSKDVGHLRAPMSPARSQSKPNASNGGIPLDRDAMMRQLRQYEEKDDANYQLSRAEMREKQNEQRREGMERRLMGGEDYMGTPEGARRLQFYENRLAMEHEDDLSHQHRTFAKQQEQARQREEMRRQMEARIKAEKEREELEKKRRQEEAEEKRRKMLEERKRQEAERKEAEDKARGERLKKEAMEAELARLEKLRLEEEARREEERKREEEERRKQEEEAARRKRELEAELDKWKQWETEQAEKEAEETKKRKQELAVQQEARKRKLEELKRLQAEGQPQVSMEEMKQENDKLNKQARIEQRAREIAAQNQGGGGKGPSELAVEGGGGGGPTDGPAAAVAVTDAELDAELQKIATLDLDAVREEQQKYMKEKRGLNIARRTWFESFREREGHVPSAEEAKEEMGEIEHQLAKLDEIVAALQRRSLELAKNAWANGPEGGDPKPTEESAKLEQLRAAEAGFIKEAGGLVETVVGRVKPQAIKTLKDLERERTKATKAKRKLKLQLKEWSDLFATLMGRPCGAEDKQSMKAVVDSLLQIEAHSDALDKRKAELENPSKALETTQRSTLEAAIFSAPSANDSVIPTFRRPSIKPMAAEQAPPPPSEPSQPTPRVEKEGKHSSHHGDKGSGSSKKHGHKDKEKEKERKDRDKEKRDLSPEKERKEKDKEPPPDRLFSLPAPEVGLGPTTNKPLRRPSSDVNLTLNSGVEGTRLDLKASLRGSASAAAVAMGVASVDEGDGRRASLSSSIRVEEGSGGATVVGVRRASVKEALGEPRRPSVTGVSIGMGGGGEGAGVNVVASDNSSMGMGMGSSMRSLGVRRSSKPQLTPVAEDMGGRGRPLPLSTDAPILAEAGGGGLEVKATPKVLAQRTPSQPNLLAPSSSTSPGAADGKILPPLQPQGLARRSSARPSTEPSAAPDKDKDKDKVQGGKEQGGKEGKEEEKEKEKAGPEAPKPVRAVPLPSIEKRRGSEARQVLAQSAHAKEGKEKEKEKEADKPIALDKQGSRRSVTEAQQQGITAVRDNVAMQWKANLQAAQAADKDEDKSKSSSVAEPERARADGETAAVEAGAKEEEGKEGASEAQVDAMFDRFLTEVKQDEDDKKAAKDKESGEDRGEAGDKKKAAAEDDFDPEIDLPGWHECMSSNMATSAHAAAYLGHYQVLEYLCRYFDVFITDVNGRTPLFYSALSDQLACCALLVSTGSDWIDVGDVRGDTPLHAACSTDSTRVLEFLLSSEASPNVANGEGLTPAHLCRSANALKLLYEAGGEIHCIDNKLHMPLFTTCAEGSGEAVDFLCQKMTRNWIGFPDDVGDTALHSAALNGHAECVAYICNAAWEWSVLNAMNHKGYSPAHVAGSVGVMQTLYEYGADVFLTTPNNRTPLFTAAAKGLSQIVEFLLQLGGAAHPDAADSPDSNGDTPLHAAACNGHEACVNLLLRYAKFPAASNSQNLSAADLARKAGMNKIAQLIEGHLNLFNKRASGGGLSYDHIQMVKKTYGSRWTVQVDGTTGHSYYYDRATGLSQWERPLDFDEVASAAKAARRGSIANEADDGEPMTVERARLLLMEFYRKVNPKKLKDTEAILVERQDNLRGLFADLEAKYGVHFLEIEKKRKNAKAMLTTFYTERNPKKLADVDRILDERSPDYDKLFAELEAKYKVTITADSVTPTG